MWQQKRDSRRIKRFISVFILQTITIILLILYFIIRFFSHRILSESTTSVIVIYREETNGRKTERKKERMCVCVGECMYHCEYRRTRVKMYNLSVRGVQEKGIEIPILFLYDKKRKNYCIKYILYHIHIHMPIDCMKRAKQHKYVHFLALTTF